VALDIDRSQSLSTNADRHRLVQAVRGARVEDETDFLEWKSTLDLEDRSHVVKVCLGIIGMANRPIEQAAKSFGGQGFVVVGAAPGNVHGVKPVDGAQLSRMITQHIGLGIRWRSDWVDVNEVAVFVVTVDPPRQGDPIFMFEREFDKYKSGAVYLRKGSITEPANAEETKLLQKRLQAGSGLHDVELLVSIAEGKAVKWFDVNTFPDDVSRWAKAATAAKARNNHENFVQTRGSKIPTSVLRIPGVEDMPRRFEEWRADVAELLLEDGSFPSVFCWSGANEVRVHISNQSDRYLESVRLVVRSPSNGVQILADLPSQLPFPPMPPKPLIDTSFLINSLRASPPAQRRNKWQTDRGIEFDLGDLRPRDDSYSGRFFVIAGLSAGETEPLTVDWTATAKPVDGVLRGSFVFNWDEHPTNVGEVLDAWKES
jgi:hypothetical protein